MQTISENLNSCEVNVGSTVKHQILCQKIKCLQVFILQNQTSGNIIEGNVDNYYGEIVPQNCITHIYKLLNYYIPSSRLPSPSWLNTP